VQAAVPVSVDVQNPKTTETLINDSSGRQHIVSRAVGCLACSIGRSTNCLVGVGGVSLLIPSSSLQSLEVVVIRPHWQAWRSCSVSYCFWY
jgi:hypothetical protein